MAAIAATALRPADPARRWDRSRRLPWFDLDRVRASRIVVVGAGALGNEVVKNLALSGVGTLDIVDPDRVEMTNLNRCLFFREADATSRRPKAEVLAERARELVPTLVARARVARIEEIDGAELLGAAAVVLCVDNVAARLHASAHARAKGLVVVDGATDGAAGKIHVAWLPEDPCIECLTNVSHRRILDERYACDGEPARIFAPPLAQEITTTSAVAALQAREAVKAALGLAEARQRGVLHYDGLRTTWTNLAASRRASCPHHEVPS